MRPRFDDPETLCLPDCDWVCHIKRSARKTMALYVRSGGEVWAYVPISLSLDAIEDFVVKHIDWVNKKRQEMLSRVATRANEERYFYFFGESYTAVWQQARRVAVLFEQSQVYLLSPSAPFGELFKPFYLHLSRQYLTPIVNACVAAFDAVYHRQPSGFTYRWVKSIWGSCSSKGNISLNAKLVAVPEVCVRYVVWHELTHLLERNHSEAFYRKLALVMPEWAEARALLRQFERRLLF